MLDETVVVRNSPSRPGRRARRRRQGRQIGDLRHGVVPRRALVDADDVLAAVRIERGLETAQLPGGEDTRVEDAGHDRIGGGRRRALRWHLAAAVGRLGRDGARGDAVDAAGGVVTHRAEEAAVELRLDAVERVVADERAAGRAAAALEEHQPAQLGVARIGRPDAGQVEVGRRVARREAGARRVTAEEDVLVVRRRAGRRHDGVDVTREDEVRPARHERDVGLRVVEDRPAIRSRRQQRVERKRELAAVEPVERDLRAQELLRDVEPGAVLELVGPPVEGPHLEHEARLLLGARDQVLRQDAEVGRAALEPGHEDEDGVGLLRRPREEVARVAGVVQAERARAGLGLQLRVGHRDARRARRVRRLRAAGMFTVSCTTSTAHELVASKLQASGPNGDA